MSPSWIGEGNAESVISRSKMKSCISRNARAGEQSASAKMISILASLRMNTPRWGIVDELYYIAAFILKFVRETRARRVDIKWMSNRPYWRIWRLFAVLILHLLKNNMIFTISNAVSRHNNEATVAFRAWLSWRLSGWCRACSVKLISVNNVCFIADGKSRRWWCLNADSRSRGDAQYRSVNKKHSAYLAYRQHESFAMVGPYHGINELAMRSCGISPIIASAHPFCSTVSTEQRYSQHAMMSGCNTNISWFIAMRK